MARYLARNCPSCQEPIGLVIPEAGRKEREKPVSGICPKCGYEFRWKVFQGKRKSQRKFPRF